MFKIAIGRHCALPIVLEHDSADEAEAKVFAAGAVSMFKQYAGIAEEKLTVNITEEKSIFVAVDSEGDSATGSSEEDACEQHRKTYGDYGDNLKVVEFPQ